MNHFIMKLTLFVIIFGSLNGCALSPKEKMATYPDGAKLAYVSLIGDTFEISVIGTTVFNNEGGFFNVSNWDIDSYIEKSVIESSKGERFEFQAIEIKDKYMVESIINERSEPDILMAEAKKQGADFLVVFAPKYQGYLHQGTLFQNQFTQYLSGIGLTKLSKFGNERDTSLYSSSKTYIYDLNMMEEIGNKPTAGIRFSKELHMIKFDSLTADDIESIEEELKDIVLLQAKNQLRDLYICNCW